MECENRIQMREETKEAQSMKAERLLKENEMDQNKELEIIRIQQELEMAKLALPTYTSDTIFTYFKRRKQ